jgi:hypothetical protein
MTYEVSGRMDSYHEQQELQDRVDQLSRGTALFRKPRQSEEK